MGANGFIHFRCVQSDFVALLHILVLDQTKQCIKISGGWDTVFVVFQKPRSSPMSTPSSDLAIREDDVQIR